MRLPDPLQKKRQPSPMASVVAAGSRPSRSLSSALLTVRISVTLTTLAFGKPPSPFLSETFTGSFRKIQVRGNEADHCRRNQTSIEQITLHDNAGMPVGRRRTNHRAELNPIDFSLTNFAHHLSLIVYRNLAFILGTICCSGDSESPKTRFSCSRRSCWRCLFRYPAGQARTNGSGSNPSAWPRDPHPGATDRRWRWRSSWYKLTLYQSDYQW